MIILNVRVQLTKINTEKKGAFLRQFTFSASLTYFERGEISKSKLSHRIPIGHSPFYLFLQNKQNPEERKTYRTKKSARET